jgi:two-component system, chemotaxis family, protein-glutamate methylesterase/glutaminase
VGRKESVGADAPGRVVGFGASAGGVDALLRIVETLPASFPAAICIVLHVPSSGRSLLAPILARRTALEVVEAEDGQRLEAGRVYVAPNDRHLVLADGHIQLDRGPKENGVRPAVDPLLRTLATAYGGRAIAVILSGALGDGSAGASAVRQAGGVVLVQDPEDATVPSMPESALRAVGDAVVLDAHAIGGELLRLVEPAAIEEDAAAMQSGGNPNAQSPLRPEGNPSPFTCPECNGSLWEVHEGEVVRYRCRVGHSYSEDAMIGEQGSAAEDALERAELIRRALAASGERPHAVDRRAGAAE